ncbi:glycosyltransferase [Iodobacter arcticus]|uniref:Glycosyltransferase n=1 Tax=Iodobacter arcticus TaxID=590593 RepID=A0ABW2QWT2_9NEIS
MKVLQFGKFYPPVVGGIESVMFNVTEGLNINGIKTDVLCSNTIRESTSLTAALGYQVSRSSSWGKLFSTSISPSMISMLAKSISQYDILHVHLPDPMASLAIWLVRPKCKIVIHWHNDIVKQKHLLKLYSPLQNWLLSRADAIIATSPVYMNSSVWLAPYKVKTHVIPIGIADPLPGNPIVKLNPYEGKKIVFGLGRLTFQKGFKYLVESAKFLPDDYVILIGGTGPMYAELSKIILDNKLTEKVILLGEIPHFSPDLSFFFQIADVFCLSSITKAESFGVVLLEAMAFSLPCIATNIEGSGAPWVNVDGETGFNVAIMNPEALADAIIKIVSDKLLIKDLSLNARNRYLDNFTSGKMVDLTIELYNKIV